MPFLNQRSTGKPCPHRVKALQRAVEGRDGGSMMQYVSVYCFDLAMVLDRLEALEEFKAEVLTLASSIRRKGG